MIRILTLFLLAFTVGLTGTTVEEFFAQGAKSSDITAPADGIFPNGQKMGFAFYAVGAGKEGPKPRKDLEAQWEADRENIFRSGAVTMVGQQYCDVEDHLKLAEKYNLSLALAINPVVEGQKLNSMKKIDQWVKDKRPFPVKEVTEGVTEVVKKAAPSKRVAWWVIIPNELRFWKSYEIQYLELATKIIRENDPLKRPIYMYEPNHRTAEPMAKTGKFTDLIGKGMYTNYASSKNQRVFCRWTMEEVKGALKLLGRSENMAITHPEMFQQPEENEVPMIETWVRHDTYCSLINGAKGMLIFSARRREGFTAFDKYLAAYLKVGRELEGPMKLSKPFLFGTPLNDLEVNIQSGPETVKGTFNKKEMEFPSLSFTNLALDGVRYIFIANSANEGVDAAIGGFPNGTNVMVKDLFSDHPSFRATEGEFEVKLPALGVAAYKLYRNN